MNLPKIADFALSKKGRKKLSDIGIVFFDFDGVFTNNTVLVSENGVELAKCSRFDGLGLKLLQDNGIIAHIISSEPNPIVAHRSKKLNIPCVHNVACKVSAANNILKAHRLTCIQSAFVGNDINDIELMNYVGVSIAVCDAWPAVFNHADAVTTYPGGYGAVREICEVISGVV